MKVLRKMMTLATTDRERAMAWLTIGAIFFAMRSCEYLRTAAEDTKRTRIVTIGNIIFKTGSTITPHDHDKLHLSDLVRIRFTYQKNDRRDVCIHMFKSGDKVLCPVRAWAMTVKRVRNIPGTDDTSPVCLFQDSSGNITHISAEYVRLRLRAVVDIMGKQKLGFTKEEIGLHSIRSGGAMAMFLSGTSVIIIMRVGRWSSEAFLEYIRDQIESFTRGVSSNMLHYEDFFDLNSDDKQIGHQAQRDAHQNNLLEQSVDGADSIPFQVKFNELALDSKKGRRSKR